MTRIGLHIFVIHNIPAIISTVEIFPGEFETMVMYEDGDELECIRTNSRKAACKAHNEAVQCWNDRVYEGSTAKLLGAANLGQFVTAVVTC